MHVNKIRARCADSLSFLLRDTVRAIIMLEGSANGVTGLYNVSNTCYMNSVLRLSATCGNSGSVCSAMRQQTSLNAADGSRGSPAANAPITADEILTFPGFRSRRKRKKTECGEDEPAIVPPSESLLFGHPPLFPRNQSFETPHARPRDSLRSLGVYSNQYGNISSH